MKGQEQLFSSKNDSWTTPKELFAELNSICRFNVDLAASQENHLCKAFFTEATSCLDIPWDDIRGFLNPPYSKVGNFVAKAIGQDQKAEIVCLLVAGRIDTRWFHSLPNGTPVFIFKGRLKFGQAKSSAPFPSILILLGKEKQQMFSFMNNSILLGKGRWVVV
jgi:phage N-6-adenine-methyltransferase